MRRSMLLTLVASVVAILVLAAAAGASPATRPFKGSVSGTVTFVGDPNCAPPIGIGLRTDGAGTGTVSHLGKTTLTSAHCSAFVFSGLMTLTAANGDELVLAYQSVDGAPGNVGEVFVVHHTFQFVGGTGRFEDATGGGVMTAYVLFEGFPDPVWPVTWEWKGTIGY